MTLVWASGYNGITDPDAQTYIAAVEAADGQAIEGDVALAINDFVVGCKDDGIWDAIKASCILAGARTLSGALVPLKGTAPTNNNFVAADYNRETGLKGNGSTKYLDSNRANNANPQNSIHVSAHISNPETRSTITAFYLDSGSGAINGRTSLGCSSTTASRLYASVNSNNSALILAGAKPIGLVGASRGNASNFDYRIEGVSSSFNQASEIPTSNTFGVFARTGGLSYTNARLSFYSIGESIDLEQLDNRTTRLMNLISYSLASGLPDLSTMDLDAASYIGAVYRAGGTLS